MSTGTERFYDHFSPFYPLVDFFLKPQKRRLFQELNKQPAGSLLEIGVGTGNHLHLYKKHKVTGIDTSLKMLQRAKKRNRADIELLHMNGENLTFNDQTFDYVILSHVITVVDNPEQLLEETHRVLKPGGQIFILNHFTPNNWLRYLDGAFLMLSKMFHFKSVFYINSLTSIKKFRLLKEIGVGRLSYFKLLIYSKA